MARRRVLNPRQNRYFYRRESAGITSLSEAHQCTVYKPTTMHVHSDLQILGILGGKGVGIETPKRSFRLQAGQVVIIPPGQKHRFLTGGSTPGADFLDILISPQQQPVFTGYLAKFARMKWVYPASRKDLLALRDEMRRLFESPAPSLAAVMEKLWRLVVLVEKASYHPDKHAADNQPDDIRLRLAENRMEELLDDDIDVTYIAAKVGLSVSQLTRLYLEEFKMTPGRRLREKRLQRAKEFLVASQLSVKEIALSCGFQDPNHFCRIFKKYNHISPGQYRKSNRS
jgi:AraC-like DNA-binding protein/mannose-6-phosphate isomerase-like protein (cupin superfamily)